MLMIDDLEHLVQSITVDFDIIAVSKSRLLKNKLPKKVHQIMVLWLRVLSNKSTCCILI